MGMVDADDNRHSGSEQRGPAEQATEHSAGGDAVHPCREHGGRVGPEPTRYGDWEKNGRCIDF